MGGQIYGYKVRYTNSCGAMAATAGAAGIDDAEADRAMAWSGAGKNQISWSSTSGADGYVMYRGTQAELANLPGGASACVAYQGAGTTTGAILSNSPSLGTFYWYLLVAARGGGEGTPGANRGIVSSGPCASP